MAAEPEHESASLAAPVAAKLESAAVTVPENASAALAAHANEESAAAPEPANVSAAPDVVANEESAAEAVAEKVISPVAATANGDMAAVGCPPLKNANDGCNMPRPMTVTGNPTLAGNPRHLGCGRASRSMADQNTYCVSRYL